MIIHKSFTLLLETLEKGFEKAKQCIYDVETSNIEMIHIVLVLNNIVLKNNNEIGRHIKYLIESYLCAISVLYFLTRPYFYYDIDF